MSTAFTQPIVTARRAQNIRYAVRDVVLVAREAAAAGKDLLYLNIGDPNVFDFVTPPHIVEAISQALRDNQTSYTASEGLPAAIEAIRQDAEERCRIRNVRDVFLGNGASECIEVALSALVDEGDNVLTPSPGYPFYTAVLGKLGCPEVPYFLDEARGWLPDVDDIAAKITPRTRALVLINPNNPTGSVCDRKTLEAILELAARHGIVVFADEIYDRLLLDDDAKPISIASLTEDAPILTFNGLSKAYLGPGLRVGWCTTSGPEAIVRPYIDTMHRFLRARLCAGHPVQHAVAPALQGDQSHIVEALGRLRRRRDITVERLNAIEGISCVAPKAAFYAFPRLEENVDDEAWVKDLIRQTGVVTVHGSGFGQKPGTSHFRVVFLPPDEILERAFAAIAGFMSR
ncbi:MAG: aminotransferase class I/II-fold pyridoxal phosphate-dependent enzyme [Deltaproteobacteria bacterium]|nr:aminotransferase class I/II-fold pyridoxal phosphate-dependent enzyme [Deltaproteobacteria bacterium]